MRVDSRQAFALQWNGKPPPLSGGPPPAPAREDSPVLARLVLLFTILPLVELGLLLWIADHTSWLFTLGLVILTGVLGASLARHQGLQCWREFHRRVSQGELPTDPLLDGLMILVAAALLVTPGVITDCVGFSLLAPPIRRLIRGRLAHRLKAKIVVGPFSGPGGAGPQDDDVIDVESRPAGDSHSSDE